MSSTENVVGGGTVTGVPLGRHAFKVFRLVNQVACLGIDLSDEASFTSGFSLTITIGVMTHKDKYSFPTF